MEFKKVDAQIAVLGCPNGLGAALVEIYGAGAAHAKIDMLDQVVSIIRRIRKPDERAREIADLMSGWHQMRGGLGSDE
jgi:hypothetical protein